MTEIAVRETDDIGLSPLAVWAESARRAASVAVSLAKTPFVPQSLRERPTSSDAAEVERAHGITAANVTAAILTGQEIGLEPMASLRSIDVIQGTPAMRAVALRGLVQSRGHEVWVEEATVTRAIVAGRRRGDQHVQKSTWTMDRAKALGLVGEDNWRKQPQAMLVARATAELCRLVAADVILGVPYAVEELQDGDEAEVVESKPRRTARRAAAEKPLVLEPPEPTLEPASQPEAASVTTDEDGQQWPEPPADWEPTT